MDAFRENFKDILVSIMFISIYLIFGMHAAPPAFFRTFDCAWVNSRAWMVRRHAEVLAEVLGYSEEQIAKLKEEAII